jgi:hypothetical protein
MPSRWVCVAVVAFWLAANAWLFWRDVLPAYQTGRPPPFTIDFIDEVEMNSPPQTPWRVWRDGEEVYRAVTGVTAHKEDDTFELNCRVTPNPLKGSPPPGKGLFTLKRFESHYRVARDGDLLDMAQTAEGDLNVRGFPVRVTYALDGRVRDGRLVLRQKAQLFDQIGVPEDPLEPLPLPPRASVLAPLHPMNRMQGLRPGQSWNQLFVDLASGSNVTGARLYRQLPAQVRTQPEALPWRGRDAPCLVVAYEDDDCEVLTWVERDGGLVLRQQVTYDKASARQETWTLERER